jgi:hypothetical protein
MSLGIQITSEAEGNHHLQHGHSGGIVCISKLTLQGDRVIKESNHVISSSLLNPFRSHVEITAPSIPPDVRGALCNMEDI